MPSHTDAVSAGSDGVLFGDGRSGGDSLSRLGNQVPACRYAVPPGANEVLRGWYTGSNGMPGIGNQVPAYGHALSGGGYQVPARADQVPTSSYRLRTDSGGNSLSACGHQLQRFTGCYNMSTGSDTVPASANRLQQCNRWPGGNGVPSVSDQVPCG